MDTSNRTITRRQFIRRAASSAGLMAAAAATLHPCTVQTADNPFAYDVQRLEKTDPRLIAYDQARRFPTSNRGARRLAVAGEGQIYVAGRNGVTVHSSNGSVAREIKTSEPARCVAVSGEGKVYVGLRGHLEVFDAQGQIIKQWETPGPKTWFTGLALGESALFAADSGSRSILRYELSGKLAGRIGEKDKDRNVPGLVVPSPYLDVELGKDGLLRVNNPGRHCVHCFTVDGELEFSWGKPSGAIEGFCGCCNPIALALLADGSCVTCEKGLPRVKVHTADGAFQSVVAGPESFPENGRAGSARDTSDGILGGLDVATDAEGRVYVLDLVTGDVGVWAKKQKS